MRREEMIHSLRREEVHSICSGQVVSTISSALKELLENSIDANATNIDVKIEDSGLKSIIVTDNGHGIEEQDFHSITASHATSKIRNFSDIESIGSFGFRGEALSSLCILSDLSITTRHSSTQLGHKLHFNAQGQITEQSKMPMSIGTSVSIENIFNKFPVRYKDLRKNIKKEFAKLISTLQSFAIGFPNVKFSCTNKNDGKPRQNILNTNGGPDASFKMNIITIFGPKQWDCLVPWKTFVIPQEDLGTYSLCDMHNEVENVHKLVQISGFVSNVTHGFGRSTADRQLFYLNKRPCEQPKIAKVINEVYHQFNSTQYPFITLFLNIEKGNFDVNLTPDKRSIFLKNEKILLAIIKYSALQLFRIHAGNITAPSSFSLKTTRYSHSQPATNVLQNSQNNIQNFFPSQFVPVNRSTQVDSKSSFSTRQEAINSELSLFSFVGNKNETTKRNFSSINNDGVGLLPERKKQPCFRDLSKLDSPTKSTDYKALIESKFQMVDSSLNPRSNIAHKLSFGNNLDSSSVGASGENGDSDFDLEFVIDDQLDLRQSTVCNQTTTWNDDSFACKENDELNTTTVPFHMLVKHVDSVSLTALENFYEEDVYLNKSSEKNSTDERKFLAKLDDKNAETELRSVLSKDSFNQMVVIGQFNLGFIISKLNSDFFIVDQHASDEKFNFEDLQNNYNIPVQPLISPISMELTHQNYSLLLDNVDLFRRNGFLFHLPNDDRTPVNTTLKIIKIIATPMSKNWSFGLRDVEEMLFLLSDLEGDTVSAKGLIRPSRIRQMFASRACRKSIMIGQALKESEMYSIMKNLAKLEHPWNCPHGRPTMRHLFDMNLFTNFLC